MKTTNRFTLVALLVLGATLGASTPARAQVDLGPIALKPTGLVPGASGQATLNGVEYVGFYWYFDGAQGIGVDTYTGYLTMTCQGLKPGAWYSTTLGTVKARSDGTLSLQGQVSYSQNYVWAPSLGGLPGGWFHVGGGLDVKVQAKGNQKLVLSGLFTYPF